MLLLFNKIPFLYHYSLALQSNIISFERWSFYEIRKYFQVHYFYANLPYLCTCYSVAMEVHMVLQLQPSCFLVILILVPTEFVLFSYFKFYIDDFTHSFFSLLYSSSFYVVVKSLMVIYCSWSSSSIWPILFQVLILVRFIIIGFLWLP